MSESAPEGPKKVPSSRSQELKHLVGKIGTELKAPKQFFDSPRRKELFDNGRKRLLMLARKAETKMHVVETQVQENILRNEQADGTIHYLLRDNTLHAAVFPPDAALIFRPPHEPEPENFGDDVKAYISGTTNISGTSDSDAYPSEGYRTHAGTIVPFMGRRGNDQEQHGGFVVDNISGQVQVVDYPSLLLEQTKKLHEGQYVIEANWYMDSENYLSVVSRPNLQRRDEYNALGTLTLETGESRYFSVSSVEDYFGVLSLFHRDDKAREYLSSMRQIAALCNEIAKSEHAVAWKIGGLEYRNGGTRTQNVYPYNKNSFAMYKNKTNRPA